MLTLHPQFVDDATGQHLAVQMVMSEFRTLILAAYSAGQIAEGEAATVLGITRPEFYQLAEEAGVSTCSYTADSIEAELANC